MSNRFHADEYDYDMTLYQVAEMGLGVAFKCAQCSTEFDLDIVELIKAHGGETRLRFVQRTAKCRLCQNG